MGLTKYVIIISTTKSSPSSDYYLYIIYMLSVLRQLFDVNWGYINPIELSWIHAAKNNFVFVCV